VHLKTDKVDLKKKPPWIFFFCIFLQSTHQGDMKNVVKCQKDFFGYFNALETRGVILSEQAISRQIWANVEPRRWKLHTPIDTNVSLRNVITSPDKILPIHKNSIFHESLCCRIRCLRACFSSLPASFKLFWVPFYDKCGHEKKFELFLRLWTFQSKPGFQLLISGFFIFKSGLQTWDSLHILISALTYFSAIADC
jgi:hypothetical protein